MNCSLNQIRLPVVSLASRRLLSGNEAEFVQRAKAGDVDSFSELIRHYESKIHGIVYRMCGPGEDLQDLAQEIFVRAFSAIGKFHYRDQASFRTWIYRIAVNVCINELRRRRRRKKVEGASLDQMVQTESGEVERLIPDYSQMPHEVAERKELQALVHVVLRQLAPHHQVALLMVDIEGMSYEDAAEATGCSLGTLKSRLSRARNALKQKLQQYRHDGPLYRTLKQNEAARD
jgi:RNA polymerase sigma-70 factor (ECF subfamily)